MNLIEKFGQRVRRLVHDRGGNVAMIFGLGALVLALVVGFSVDVAHQTAVRKRVQESLDAALLSAVSSTAETPAELEAVIQTFLDANMRGVELRSNWDLDVAVDGEQVTALITADTPAFFSGLLGRGFLPVDVDATAQRGSGQSVELVLVLDNTWSMSDSAGSMSRMQALQQAARALVNDVMIDDADIRVSVVPYADYVNVGMAYRNASWITVPADTTSPPTITPRSCTTTERRCTGGYQTTCTRTVDGVRESYPCTQGQSCQNVTIPERCTGPTTRPGVTSRWYGCVASRNAGDARRHDRTPSARYPGFLDTAQTCPTPILPLTTDRGRVTSAINGLVYRIGGYRPMTYIPSGMIWGVNMLSPSAPFTEGGAYGEDTRKIIVLMTDGANTMRYQASDGRHVNSAASGPADDDVRAICDYAKSLNIQIYTVGLAVPAGAPRDLMRTCATTEADAHDAADASQLLEAFRDIARSINAVRLVD